MMQYSIRPLGLGLSVLALTACMNSAPAEIASATTTGIDLGGSTRIAFGGKAAEPPRIAVDQDARDGRAPHVSGDIQLVHDGHSDAHATGVVNAVDASQHKINLTHEPIPSLGWPSMTMEFPVAPSVNLNGMKPGSRVNFTIEKGKSGMYEVQSVQPAGQR